VKPSPTDTPLSDVLAQRPGPYTAVGRPESGWTLAPAAAGLVVLGLIVFMTLSHGRRAAAQSPAPKPPQTMMAAPPVQPAAMAAPMPQPVPVLPAPVPPATFAPAMDGGLDPARAQAPALVVDLPEPAVAPAKPAASAEERFAEKLGQSTVETARATRLRDLSLVAPQGTVIPAVLETAINSDLPGFVRAVVSQDVRGFDGSMVLIPRGSRLVGQYKNAVAAGQTRAFVVWTRVLTPDGVSVEIASPSADTLGRGGLEGETNSHFLRRFGASILLSVLGAGLQSLGHDRGGDTAIVIGSPQQASSIASLALQKQIDIPTTIEIRPGVSIRVFLARDLDFTAVGGRPR